MGLKSKLTKKIVFTKIIPYTLFVLVVASAFITNSVKLMNDERQLLNGQIGYAATMYGSCIEKKLGCVEHRLVLAVDYVENTVLSPEEAIAGMSKHHDIINGAVIDAEGVGTDIRGATIDLREIGYTGQPVQDAVTYFYGNDGMLYIIKSVLKEGSFTEALVAICDFSEFDGLFTDYAYGGNDWMILLDGEGQIIYSFHADEAEYLEKGDNFIETLQDVGGSAAAVVSGIKRHRSGNISVDFKDDQRQLAYRYMEESDWVLILGVSDTYIDGALQPYKNSIYVLMFSLLGCLLLYVVIFVLNNTLDKMSGKKKSAGLLQLAETDQLTGLYNKVTTERKIKEFIEENPETQSLLFILDIDNFKKINDTMGHAFGDEVLREIGLGLKQQFRASDIIGRAGGDEFIILLKNLREDRYLIREADKLDRFFKDLQVGTYTKYSVTSSIGCAIFNRDGEDFETLYKHADEALYKAKQRGKSQYAFYTDPEGFGQNV